MISSASNYLKERILDSVIAALIACWRYFGTASLPGCARAQKLSTDRRQEIVQRLARARWVEVAEWSTA